MSAEWLFFVVSLALTLAVALAPTTWQKWFAESWIGRYWERAFSAVVRCTECAIEAATHPFQRIAKKVHRGNN